MEAQGPRGPNLPVRHRSAAFAAAVIQQMSEVAERTAPDTNADRRPAVFLLIETEACARTWAQLLLRRGGSICVTHTIRR
jgi:hypothetical protein